MTQTDLFGWQNTEGGGKSAATLRDEGATKVLERAGKDWSDSAIRLIRQRFRGEEVTGEDFRLICQAAGLNPHHPNGWGALTLTMKRAGLLKETGRWRNGRDPKSHARAIRVYQVL